VRGAGLQRAGDVDVSRTFPWLQGFASARTQDNFPSGPWKAIRGAGHANTHPACPGFVVVSRAWPGGHGFASGATHVNAPVAFWKTSCGGGHENAAFAGSGLHAQVPVVTDFSSAVPDGHGFASRAMQVNCPFDFWNTTWGAGHENAGLGTMRE
jgi:hypothetical protein